jgi:general secretion pathway protein B
MSLILEALRKSEERRRLGETPTLISQSEWAARRHHPPASRTRTWLMWTLPPLVVATLAAGWWFGLREPGQSGPVDGTAQESPDRGTPAGAGAVPAPATPTAATSAPQPQADVAPAPVALSTAPPSPAMPPPPPVTDGAPQAANTVPPDVRARFERGEVFANSADQLRPPVPTADAPIVTPEAALPEPLDDPKDVAVAAAPQPASSPPPAPAATTAPSAPVTMPAAAAPPSPPPAVASASPTPAARADTSDVPYAFELSLATRHALPPLKMSMHVYAADPAHRFVLLDGVRLVEGGDSGELRVIEIRANGVVLEFRSQRFLLPRNGG